MQLALALDGDIKPRPITQSPTQRQSFEALLAKVREETTLILESAIALTGTQYESLTKVPTPLLKQAREAVFGKAQHAARKPISVSVVPQKQGKPWSLQRKYGLRCKKLVERTRKRSTLWFFDELQSAVLENPEYFGVCPLPVEKSCVCKPGQRLGWLAQAEAQKREKELQQAGF